jgi:hypothetical protein
VETRPTLAHAVVTPSAIAAAIFGFTGLFLSTFLGDAAALAMGLGAGWASYTAGRLAEHLDLPRGQGAVARQALLGLAIGFGGLALLHALFRGGPGWPWTPWVALAAGLGHGLARAHRPIVAEGKHARAFGVLLVGLVVLGASGAFLMRTVLGFLPGGLQAILGALFALYGIRQLLAFAAEERAGAGRGFVAWLKANALQNAIVALLLVAYLAFRRDLAANMPYFALVEYGMGIALFGFVLARLRARLQRDGSALATSSEARDHERVVAELREGEHDAVARPVTRFVESGHAAHEYAAALASALPETDARRDVLAARVAGHREPPRAPPLPLASGLAAGLALSLGLGIAGLSAGMRLGAEMPFPLVLALALLGFGVYAQQDVARAHHRVWLSLGIAAAGTGVLFLDFLIFAGGFGPLALVPGGVWGIVAVVAALLLGFPALSLWRHAKRLRAGTLVDARRLAPAKEHEADTQKARRSAATLLFVAFILLFPLPWLAASLAERGALDAGGLLLVRNLVGVAIWVVAGFGAAALVRYHGLTRARDALLAREREKRAQRLALHRTLMQTIERNSP